MPGSDSSAESASSWRASSGPRSRSDAGCFARSEAGEIPEADLPNDFLTIAASHADPSFDADPDLPVREAIIDLLHAGTGTSVGAIVHTVDELERWLGDHPEDRERRTDLAFLVGAVDEVLRLHAANPAEICLMGTTSWRAPARHGGQADRSGTLA